MRTLLSAAARRTAVAAGCAALALAGCAGEDGADDPVDTPSPVDASGSADPAGDGRVVGPADSECPMPITFEVADDYTPEAVDADLEQGGLALRCEIDAKPAGMIGYIRVWTGDSGSGDLRAVLDDFLSDGGGEVEEPQYQETSVGGAPALEVTYIEYLSTLDERKQEQAFAVSTPDGVAVVTVSGLDTEEYEGMLPAYELARDSVQIPS